MAKIKRKAQTVKILEYMRTHDGITAEEACLRLNVWRLAARIKDLRKQGYNITTEMVKAPNGERFGLYRLTEG